MNICLAHHWLVTYRGGEKVLAELRKMFPSAPIATLICHRGDIPEDIIGDSVLTSAMQYIPFSWKFYKPLFPLHAWCFGHLSVPRDTQLVLSSDAAMVKGIRLPEGARHVCYCHSPPRYLWDMQANYSRGASGLGWAGRLVFNWVVPGARRFDYAAAQKIDYFIANSHFVADRIKRIYDREADVMHPPVSVDDFDWKQTSEDYYLIVTQLVPYKRVDIAVDSFNANGKRLIIIGEGSEYKSLKSKAANNIKFLGRQSFNVVKTHFERCRAFIYPQIEDFGITAVEAQAAGKPVIAFRGGGAMETVVDGQTGIFFEHQTSCSLCEAITRFEALPHGAWAERCRENAELFHPDKFISKLRLFLMEKELI
jgi:glycosyltransferase involved in cell wall biosynthesis